LKIFSVRDNARAALAAASQHGSLDRYLWSFVEALIAFFVDMVRDR
jgi:3-methyladenine DNA glycosylase Tag